MSGTEHDEMVQGEIDGVNSAAASARLRVLLASRPDLDDLFQSLSRVSETLGGAERLEPPPELLDGVMRAVRGCRPKAPARPRWQEALRALTGPVPFAACACTLLIGVVLGRLLPSDTGLFSGRERAALSGTALFPGHVDGAGTLGRRSIALEGVRGEAVTRIEGGLLVFDLELDATRRVDVSLDLDGTGLSPRSFSQDGPPGGDVLMAAGHVRFLHPAGRRRYNVSFGVSDPGRHTLRLRLGDGEAWDLPIGRERPR